MEHKEFFEKYGHIPFDSDYLVEDLYQAFKQRLIEELRTQDIYVDADDYAALESSNSKLQADNIRLTLRVENLEAECAALQARLLVLIQERDKWKHTAYHAATMIQEPT